ncbi:phage tail tape measure protein [Holzapfeliella sp. He02]|uniref:Phage tail tape measure protein n=1 Tax=Holzapfeliella saturejae TaxID=3082953 RepID=A0ABU8SI07_9LACO
MAGNIKGITIELNGDTTKLDQSLSKTEKNVKSVNGELRNVNNLLRFNPGNTELLGQKQQLLSQQISNTSSKLSTLKDAQSQVEKQFKSGDLGEDKYRAFQREVIATESKLNTYKGQLQASQNEEKNLKEETNRLTALFQSTGKKVDDFSDLLGPKMTAKIREGKASSTEIKDSINKIGRAVTDSEKDFTGFNKALSSINDGGSIKQIKKELDGLGDSSNSALQKIKSSAFAQKMKVVADGLKQAGDMAKQMAGKATSAGDEFRNASNSMIKQTGKTGDAAKDMQKAFDNIYGSTVIADSGVLADTISNVTKRFNLQGKELENVTKSIISYSKATGQDSASATNNLADVMNKFNIKASESGKVLDALVAGYQQGTFQTGELESAVSSAAPFFHELGLSVESSISMIAKWSAAGVESNEVLAGFRKARQNLTKDGGDFNAGLQKTYDAIKNSTSVTEAASTASEVFGNKAGPGLATAIKQGRLSLDDLKGGATDTSNTLKNTMGALDGTSQAQMAVQSQNLKRALSELGQAISSAVLPFIKALTPFVKDMAEKFRNLPEGIQSAIVAVGSIGAALAILAPIITSIITTIKSLSIAYKAIKEFDIISKLSALIPVIASVGWPILAVVAAIAAVIAIIMNWGTIVEWFKGIFAGLGVWIGQVVGNIKNFFSGLGKWFENLWNGMTTGVSNFIKSIQSFFDGLKTWFQQIFTEIGKLFIAYLQMCISIWTNIWNAIVSIIQAVWNVIQTIITYAIAIVATIIMTTLNVILGIWSAIWGLLGPIVQTVWNGITTTVSAAINVVSTIISNVMNFISTTWQTIWNAIVAFVQPILETISAVISTTINAISTTWQTVWNGISTVFNTVLNGIVSFATTFMATIQSIISTTINVISTTWQTVWNGISSFFTTVWNTISSTVSSVINGVSSTISSVWNGIKSTTESVWNGIKSAIQGPIETARDIVKSVIDAIKGFFSFKISWPHIPLPHFGINPSGWQIGDLLKGSIPSLAIDWHAKGGILNKPTLFTDDAGGLHGAGEAGPEAVIPLNNDTFNKLGNAIAENTDAGNVNLNLTVYGDLDSRTAKKWAQVMANELENLNRRRSLGGA